MPGPTSVIDSRMDFGVSICVLQRLGCGEPLALRDLEPRAQFRLPPQQIRNVATLALVGCGIGEGGIDRAALLGERGDPHLGIAYALAERLDLATALGSGASRVAPAGPRALALRGVSAVARQQQPAIVLEI